MVKKTIPSLKQRKMVEQKIKGKSNKEIGQEMYPNATPESQAVLVSAQLNKSTVAKYYEESKLIALKNASIDWKWIVDRVKDAGDATKMNNFTGEVSVDHTTRLSAVKQARELLEAKNVADEVKEQLQSFPSGVDEVQLVRLLKKT